MNKKAKLALLISTIVLALSGAGAWYAVSLVNPEQLAKMLSVAVKSATGRELKIDGPVSLSILPSIGVTAEQVSLSNAPWATEQQMLTLKHIEMKINLLPLIRGNVEISGMRLSGLDARLQTNKAGQGNWDMTLILDSGSPTTNSGSKDSPAQASTDTNPFVAIEHVEIADTKISYQDDKTPTKVLSLQKLSFNRVGTKTSILIDGAYEGNKLNLKGQVSLLRQAIIDWDQSPVKMDVDLVATVNGKELDIQGEVKKSPKGLPQFDLSLNSKSFDLLPLAGSAALASSGGKVTINSSNENMSKQSKYFFSDDPLPFGLLPDADGKISLNIAQLNLPKQTPLINLKADAVFKNQRIEINDLSFSLGKGSAQGQLAITDYQGTNPSIKIKWMAQGFTWEQLIGSNNSGSKVSGGQVQIAGNIQGAGLSLHQIASRANGAVQVSVGSTTLATQFLNEGGDLLVSVLDAINPVQRKSNQTVLECAVAYLPINNGMVNISNSIGIETDRLNITGNGSINLATEAINLSIDPKEKSGLTTGLDLGGLVKLQGTLQNPKTGVNQAGVVNSAVSIGLGFLTGGVSIAAENAKSMLTKTQPCKTALHSWSDVYPGNAK